MTTKKRKPNDFATKLKIILAVGSLGATFLGADLLANQAQVATAVAPPTTNGIVIVQPEKRDRSTMTINDAPIPKLTIPNPIAVSKSSA